MKTVIVIPAKDEEKRVGEVVKGAKKYGDVFVVDDGSNDRTSDVAREAGAKVFRLSKNKGKGYALRIGVKKALETKPDYVVMIDGDGQHRFEDIPKFLEKLRDYEIVFGQRTGGNMPPIKKVGNWGLHQIFSLLFGSRITDTQCGFKAFRADALKKVHWKSERYFVDTEIAAASSKFRVSVVEIPIIYHDKYKGTTIFDGIVIGYRMLKLKFGKPI